MDIILDFDPAGLVATGLDVDDDLLLLSLLSVAHLPTHVPRTRQGKPHRLIGVTLVSGNAPMRHVAASANHLIRLRAANSPLTFEKWRGARDPGSGSWKRLNESHQAREGRRMDLTLCHFLITAAPSYLQAMCPTAGISWESARICCLSSTVLAGDHPCGRGANPANRHRLPGASHMHTCPHLPQDAHLLGRPSKFHGRRRLRGTAFDVRMLTRPIFISHCTPLQTVSKGTGLSPVELPPCCTSPCDDIQSGL
jgi:hypothetical protein